MTVRASLEAVKERVGRESDDGSHIGMSRAEFHEMLPQRIADHIREAITRLQEGFQPGDRLLAARIAAEVGVSITPVREALKILVAEGVLESMPRRGVRVIRMSVDDIRDLSQVRASLEMAAIRLRGRLSKSEVAAMMDHLAQCEIAIDKEDMAGYRAGDSRFHNALVGASRSPRLIALYDLLGKQARVLELYYPDQWDSMRESLEEHRALARQLGKGPVDRSQRAIWQHWEHGTERFVRMLSDIGRPPHVAITAISDEPIVLSKSAT